MSGRRPRGEARRRALLEATLAVLGREGVGGVTHRAVAAEAGVPLASTTYYFGSRDELLLAAFALAVEQDVSRLEREARGLAEEPLTAETLADRLAAMVLGWLSVGQPTLAAQVELYLQAARRPELSVLSRDWTRAYVEALTPPLAAFAVDDPLRDARVLFAALNGLFVDQLVAPEPAFERAVLRPSVRRLVGALLAGAHRDDAVGARAARRA